MIIELADNQFKSKLLTALWDINPLADARLSMTPDQIISRIEFALNTTHYEGEDDD